MKVKFYAYLRDYTKTKAVDIEYQETLEKLLHAICDKYGDRLKKEIFDGDNLSRQIIVMVNGRHIVHLEGIKTKLESNDEIAIFPTVAGG